jgi:hypothetical protein
MRGTGDVFGYDLNALGRPLKNQKDKMVLVLAIVCLIAGIVALLRGHASWYGAGRISGGEVIAFSFVCFVFSAVWFVLYFRR